jgi:hypothetical protein
MTDQFAMPNYLELEATRRNGIPAVRRKMVHNTTSQNEYRPGELCYIPIDTGANGAFMDTSTTRLKMTVIVRNKNYLTDFINLPRCGWHAIIQEFGIEVNNTLHELNRHYAECIELDMIKKGENKHPFKMVMSNPYKLAGGVAGELHINFVKPSMVTLTGLPHNVQYKTMDYSTSSDFITQSYLLQSNPFVHHSFGLLKSMSTTASAGGQLSYKDVQMTPSSLTLAQSFYDDRISAERSIQNIFKQSDTVDATGINSYPEQSTYFTLAGITSTGVTDAQKLFYSQNATQIGSDMFFSETSVPYSNRNRISGGPTIADIGLYSKVSIERKYNDSDTQTTSTAGQSYISHSPGQWPARQPTDLPQLKKDYEDQLRWVNSANVMDYYAHTLNIPVGIPVHLESDVTGKETVWGETTSKSLPAMSDSERGQETYFHVSLKVYSSLIGVLAKKWFPELVVPQGRMRIRLRFQEPNVLFQTLSDPCRRVPGTPRDWFPNLGVSSTSWTPYAYTSGSTTTVTAQPVVTKTLENLRQVHPSKIFSSVHPIMISDYKAGDVFNSAVAMGKYVVPQMKFVMMSEIMKAFNVRNHGTTSEGNHTNASQCSVSIDTINCDSVKTANKNYTDFLTQIPDTFTAGGETMSINFAHILPKFIYNLEKNSFFGNAPVRYKNYDTTTGKPIKDTTANTTETESEIVRSSRDVAANWNIKISDLQNYIVPTSFHSFCKPGHELVREVDGNVGTLTTYDNATEADWHTDPYWDWEEKGQCWNPFCVPTPQYLPMKLSSLKNTSKTRNIQSSDFADESYSYFGTHLEKSEAQVRRSAGFLLPLKMESPNSYGAFERLTYIIRDVQLETEQIILPRQAALSIVENALNGGINMETTTWKEMESILPQAKTQKHLINMAAAYCSSISFLFRPQSIFTTDGAFGYDSFSFYNPFSYFTFEKPSTVDSEAEYNNLGGIPVYQNALTFQERLGINLQLQLSSELVPRFPINTISDLLLNTRWGDQVFDDSDYMDLGPKIQPSYQVVKGQSINTLQDGFWASYVPITALDDQSITCNPFFTTAEISIRSKLRGGRWESGCLPDLKPYKGSFHLSFNLEAYMGQSDRIRTGVPIVNNNMFLIFDLGYLLEKEITQLLTVAVCDAKVVFERGGTMQFFS